MVKDNEIWNKIRELTGKKLHSKPISDNIYINSKVKRFNDVVHTNFYNKNIPRKNTRYICLAVITADFIMRMD